MDCGRNCFKLQRAIQRQTLLGKVLDEQIDSNQCSATSQLKKLLIAKFIQSQRILIAETKNSITSKDISEFISLSNNTLEVEDSFTSLDLPEDFSSVPIKSFMNTLFDNFPDFLPHFYKISPSKIPPSTQSIDTVQMLLRSVFPALFGYCWAEESANSYAKYLTQWFGEIVKKNGADFRLEFDTWLSSALHGFFVSLNVLPFIRESITPIFMEFVQIVKQTESSINECITKYAQLTLENIKQNYNLLPKVVNTLFQGFIDVINESEIEDKNAAIKEVCKIVFYEVLLRPIFMNPTLYGVSTLPLSASDYIWFDNIYYIIAAKLGCDIDKKKYNEIEGALSSMTDFDPYSILTEITENKARYPLPSLQSFCDIVQCAHQPLLFTTKTILVLFRFICSIQGRTDFPSSMKRPINQIITQNLDDQLEQIEEMPFWFQCFTMSYLGIGNISIKKKKQPSPIYRLLSNPLVMINPEQADVKEALVESLENICTETNPTLRTEMLWILNKTENFDEEIVKLSNEIDSVAVVLNEKRERAKNLNIFSRIITELSQAVEDDGVPMAISANLMNDFNPQVNAVKHVLSAVKKYLGDAFQVFGKYVTYYTIMKLKPMPRSIMSPMPIDKTEDDETRQLRQIAKRPLNVSSLLPIILQLAKDVSTILEYGMMNGIERPVYRCYCEPFIEMPRQLSNEISILMKSLSKEMKKILFTEKDIQAINAFVLSFS